MRSPIIRQIQRQLLCGLIAGFLCSTTNAAEKVVLLGDDDYAPYSYVDNGQFKGMYVELLQKAAEFLKPGYEIELKPRPWKRGLAEMESGAAFALFPPGFKKERPYLSVYSTVLYTETVAIFCNADVMAIQRNKFPDDFMGLTIGVNAGFLLSTRLIDAAKAGKITLSEAKGNEANIKKLAAKRVACYASDRGAAFYTVKKLQANGELNNFKLQEAVELSGEDTFIGYSAHNNPTYKADFIMKMNAAIETIKKNGIAAKIESSYLK